MKKRWISLLKWDSAVWRSPAGRQEKRNAAMRVFPILTRNGSWKTMNHIDGLLFSDQARHIWRLP